MKVFELLNKNVVVLEFRYDDALHRIDSIERECDLRYASPALVDADGQVTLRNLIRWWERRSIPASRAQLDRLKAALSIEDTAELLEKNNALSLSDRYWVREKGQSLEWADVNFFDNDFTDDLGVITLDPSSSGTPDAATPDLLSPNSSVGGNLPKKWVIENGVRYLVKAGIQNFGQDVFNEAVATSLHRRLLKAGEYAPYELVWTASDVYCRCPEFLGPDEELVSADDLLRRHRADQNFGSYRCIRDAILETGLEADAVDEGLSKLFTCDFLVANTDRHTNNFGVVRNVETLEYLRLAPIFDSGFGLWCDRRVLEKPSDYDYRPRPFTNSSDYPLQQLRLFDSYDWFDPAALEGWVDEAMGLLAEDELIGSSRLSAIRFGIERNVELCLGHVEVCQSGGR